MSETNLDDDGCFPTIPHVIAAGSGDDEPSRVVYEPGKRSCCCVDTSAFHCIRTRYLLGQVDSDEECVCVCHSDDEAERRYEDEGEHMYDASLY